MLVDPDKYTNGVRDDVYGQEEFSNSPASAPDDMRGKSVAERKDWIRREFNHVLRDN